ncbi:hypothetical protein BAUCODRAFT_72890, partial [Baudoinia panamericana UAMH 10762]
DFAESDASPAVLNRRPLRARTEKQLHPYLHDRTLYHQQWRQRGLKPVHFRIVHDGVEETQSQSSDPMLAASTRRNHKPSVTRIREPKITDALRGINQQRQSFSEERGGVSAFERPRTVIKRTRGWQRQQRPKQQSCGHRLSILDVTPVMSNDAPLPQFLRLARRQAQQQTNHGRHSPSNKVVRLATEDDTAEANQTLNAWREGTIAPCHTMRRLLTDFEKHRLPPPADEGLSEDRYVPLRDISNLQQGRLPQPLRKSASLEKKSRRVVTTTRRHRQTQLELIVLRRDRADAVSESQDRSAQMGDPEELDDSLRRRRNRQRPQITTYRNAQLESLESTFDQHHRSLAFVRRINCLTEAVTKPARSVPSTGLQRLRYLQQHEAAHAQPSAVHCQVELSSQTDHFLNNNDHQEQMERARLPLRQRKRLARHLNADSRHYRQPSEPLPDVVIVEDFPIEEPTTTSTILNGLGPFGSRYATDFDVRPLPLGIFFHESTFIGSGDFAASLRLNDRNFATVTGRMRVHVGEQVLEWGPWTEGVASGMAKIPQGIRDASSTLVNLPAEITKAEQLAIVRSNVEHMLRSIVRYCSKCLAFLDPVDRRACIIHLQGLVENLDEVSAELSAEPCVKPDVHVCCLQYTLVIAMQVSQLCNDYMVTHEVKQRTDELVKRSAQKLAEQLYAGRMEDLRATYETLRHHTIREAGIRNDDISLSTAVLLRHGLRRSTNEFKGFAFWDVIEPVLANPTRSGTSVSVLDQVWYGIFTLLPALEVDEYGIARPGSRFQTIPQGWSLPKQLLGRLFSLYPATASGRSSTINDYVRATLSRCYRLVSDWGWSECEPVLSTIFDFFACRGFAQLEHEQSHGSVAYLDVLEASPSLELQPEDQSFHSFLKILALGLLNMRKYGVYSDRKISGIVWRFVPNHGRTYRKDADVKQSDIEALRNHFDLLCTLYFASPPSHRLRPELLQNLVDHTQSHREACRLSVRAWTHLASFQASSALRDEALQPFTVWFQDILVKTVGQYRLAKTEAERDFATARAQGVVAITDCMLTTTIASNQRQIAATLVDVLAGLKRALNATNNLPTAVALIQGCNFWKIFVPFDVSERRLLVVLDEAIQVLKTALTVESKLLRMPESQLESEESQDYGDLDALQALTTGQGGSVAEHSSISEVLQSGVAQLLSNIFGSDGPVEDTILAGLVDVWADIVHSAVEAGRRSLSSFTDEYSIDSWRQLRDTDHKRKWTPYFYARLVVGGVPGDSELQVDSLRVWLVSLVEREALLKHQHLLTAALSNSHNNHAMLHNLPFTRNPRTARFDVSLDIIRVRRLAVLSIVLSNMREDFDKTLRTRPGYVLELRKEYGDLLKALMLAMKSNYQELCVSPNNTSADANAEGSYVEFVQHIISFLQQHTIDICPVDGFFTNSSAFPLPAGDPMYVEGRLKSYVPKLADGRTRKQLAVFVHTVSERAAVDDQQAYLVQQLVSAMDGVLDCSSTQSPSLRHVLLTAIFPAYIRMALSTACSWILALPILEACAMTVDSLMYQSAVTDEQHSKAMKDMLISVLLSLKTPISEVLDHPGLLRLPHSQRVLTLVFEVLRAMLTVSEFLQRSKWAIDNLDSLLPSTHAAALDILARMEGANGAIPESLQNSNTDQFLTWPDTQTFTRQQVENALEKEWYAYDGHYFVRRGTSAREVIVHLADDDTGLQGLLASVKQYCVSYSAVMASGQALVRGRGDHDVCDVDSIVI